MAKFLIVHSDENLERSNEDPNLTNYLINPATKWSKFHIARVTKNLQMKNSVAISPQMTLKSVPFGIDLARSTNGTPISSLTPGAEISETRSGISRSCQVTDPILMTDPLHPSRFLRLKVE
jgi:hypothetical protein